MSTQRYSSPVARERMGRGRCPECGEPPEHHLDDIRFWIPRSCSLLTRGVIDRIDQYKTDLGGAS